MTEQTAAAAAPETEGLPEVLSEPPAAPALVFVQMPDNCKRDSLSIDALDRYTREMASRTYVDVDGHPLLCRSIKLVEQGGETCLQLTVRPYCFEINR